jgi:hypothetical protein
LILDIKYLNIPAMSTAIEGNFNSSTNIITNYRTKLKHDTRKELLIIKYNKKNKDKLKTKRYPDLELVSSSESEAKFDEGEDSDFY